MIIIEGRNYRFLPKELTIKKLMYFFNPFSSKLDLKVIFVKLDNCSADQL